MHPNHTKFRMLKCFSFQVHIFTVKCNKNRASCVCGVAVRSGRDSLILDKCNPRRPRFKLFDCLDFSIRVKEHGRNIFTVSDSLFINHYFYIIKYIFTTVIEHLFWPCENKFSIMSSNFTSNKVNKLINLKSECIFKT